MDYHIGDRVKIIGNDYYNHAFSIGSLGIVKSKINLFKYEIYSFNNNFECIMCTIHPIDLELVSKAVKVGDKVKIIYNRTTNPHGQHAHSLGDIAEVLAINYGDLTFKTRYQRTSQLVLIFDTEPVKKTRAKRVKIGDRVRIIANSTLHYYCDWRTKPVFAKIIALQNDRGQYKTEPIEGTEIGNNMPWQVLIRSDFELAPILLPVLLKQKKKKAKADNFECGICGDELNTGSEFEFENTVYCEECYNESIGHCENCSDIVLQDTMYEVQVQGRASLIFNTSWICEPCLENYTNCKDCQQYFNSDIILHTRGDYYLCPVCYENGDYFNCGNCGDIDHNDNRYGDYCESCRVHEEEDEYDSDNIHGYDYKPEPTFYRGDDHEDKLFMGIELELEVGTGSRSEVAEQILKDPLYCKSDGSIDYGFEIVTHPCTLAYHKKQMKWDDMLAKLIKAKCKSHDTNTCGLHIHVSKKALSHIEAIRLGIFVNLNCNNFETLARRTQSHYSKFKFVKKGRVENKRCSTEKGEYLSVINNGDRYEALNYQNRSTIEFRLYKGTLKYHTLISTIELTHAVCYFVKQVDSTLNLVDKEKGWKLFMDFVKKNCKTYPNLIEYLQAKELLTKTDNPVSQESEAIEV